MCSFHVVLLLVGSAPDVAAIRKDYRTEELHLSRTTKAQNHSARKVTTKAVQNQFVSTAGLDMQDHDEAGNRSASTWLWTKDQCKNGRLNDWGTWMKDKLHMDFILKLTPTKTNLDCDNMMKAANHMITKPWVENHARECLSGPRSLSDLGMLEKLHIFPDLQHPAKKPTGDEFFMPIGEAKVTVHSMINEHVTLRTQDSTTNLNKIQLPYGVNGVYGVTGGEVNRMLRPPQKCATWERKQDNSPECVKARLFVASAVCGRQLMDFIDREFEPMFENILKDVREVTAEEQQKVIAQMKECKSESDTCDAGLSCSTGRSFRGPVSAMAAVVAAVPAYLAGWPLKAWLVAHTSGWSQLAFAAIGEPEILAGLMLVLMAPVVTKSDLRCRPTACDWDGARCLPKGGGDFTRLLPHTKCTPTAELNSYWRETGDTICEIVICPRGENGWSSDGELHHCAPIPGVYGTEGI